MVNGKGNPNNSKEYQEAVQLLYSISYTLKMKVIKKQQPENDYVVPPLEGLWFMDDMNKWSMENKEQWQWIMMIRIPDFVKENQINLAVTILKESKNPKMQPKLYWESYDEGECVQLLYVGPYNDEPPIIKKMHQFAKDNGYLLSGKHHEIYLSDPRKIEPEKLKTILRQPITKREKD